MSFNQPQAFAIKLLLCIFFIALSSISNAQKVDITDAKKNKIKLRKYNKKNFSADNYFYQFTDSAGYGLPKSKLRIVKPNRPFWGNFKEEGSAIIILQDRLDKKYKGQVLFTEIAKLDVPHPVGNKLSFANQYYFPETLYSSFSIDSVFQNIDVKKAKKLSRIKYTDYKFVFQTLTIPLKFRKAQDTLTYQTETSFNLGFGLGVKWSHNWYAANKSFLGQKTNQLSFTPGILLGFSTADIKAKVNASATFKDRKEPIFSYGAFFLVGINNINIGFAIGSDLALKNGRKAGGWVYDSKPWTGIIFALDIIK